MVKKNVLTQGKKANADRLALEGRLEEAQALYASVNKADPTDVEALVKQCVTLRRLGRYDEAERCGKRAVLLAPKLAFAQHGLAAVLQCQGRVTEAIAGYRLAIQLKPDFADAHYLLGNALLAVGQYVEAVPSLRRAIELRGNFFEALSDLGAALLALGRVDEAPEILERALALRPNSAEVLSNLANLAEMGGKPEDALALYRRALELNPDTVDVMGKLAEFLERTGHTDDAAAMAARGLKISPMHPLLNLASARLERREGKYAAAAQRLEALLANGAQDANGEVHLLLGQLHDRLEQSDKVLPCLMAGKQRAAQATDPEGRAAARFLQKIDAYHGRFGPASRGAEIVDAGVVGQSPVFLIGFPRSGTTLLEQVLDSHPRLQTLEEKPMMAAVEQALQAIVGSDTNAPVTLDDGQVARLRAVYWEEARKHIELRPGALLVDKLPLNIIRVPLIWRVFPEARFILALRHPCDVTLSCLMQNFGVNDAMAGFVSLEGIAQIYAKVMGGWLENAGRLPLHWQRIRYEDLITNFEAETRALLEFLGVGWDDAVLEHTRHAQQRGIINTPSYHQVTQPIYQHARYRWKRYAKDFEPLLPVLQPFIEAFGYA